MKGQVCHLGALMTDCVSLFWLEISFNMHDKRRPSGTLPTNSADSPLRTPAVSVLHRFIISGSFLMTLTGIPDWTLTCAGKCAQQHSSLLKGCTKLYVLTVIRATKTAHFPLLSSVLAWWRQTDVKTAKYRGKCVRREGIFNGQPLMKS